MLEEPPDPVTSPLLLAVSLDVLGSGSGSVFPVSATRWQWWGAEATERACGSLIQAEPWETILQGIGQPSTGISGGARVQGYCLEQPTESEACRHPVGSTGPGLGTHQEAGRRRDRPGPGTGHRGLGEEGQSQPSAHTHLQEALGRLTSREKAARGFSVCSRPSVSSGSRHRNAHTTHSASGRGLSSQTGSVG